VAHNSRLSKIVIDVPLNDSNARRWD